MAFIRFRLREYYVFDARAGWRVELNRASHISFRQPTFDSIGGPSLFKMNDPQADLSFRRRCRLVHINNFLL